MREKKRILWCDAEANCRRMASREDVAEIVRKARAAGIDSLIVDVRPLGGEALYKSSLVPRLGEVDGFEYPKEFDLLATMVEEGHAVGLEVYAAINVFSEGHRQWGRGPGYEHPEWQSVMYEADRTLTLPSGFTVTVERIDPWSEPDEPAIFTRPSDVTRRPSPGRTYIAIDGTGVLAVYHGGRESIPIPESGCLLSLLASGDAISIRVGDRVQWDAQPAFRRSEDSRVPSWGIFVNPIGPAREYELRVIEEIVASYPIEGIVFDRMRYPNLYGDFSDLSRRAFETWLEKGSIVWPEDVLAIAAEPWKQPVQGTYYRRWLEWRAWQIHDFARDAVDLVRATNPRTKAVVYVGSWYESYYDVGVNWASRDFHPGYEWMTPEYSGTAIAEMFDFICTGCYYPTVTREEARSLGRPEGATVEAACDLSRRAIMDRVPTYASLYLRDYAGRPDDFSRAVKTCISHTDGVMLFDLVYLEDYAWWDTLGSL